MWFAIIAQDHPGTLDKRLAARAEHLERLNKLQDEGRMLLAGPFPAIESENPGPAGFTGSLIIVEFPSQAEAARWAGADPLVAPGL